MKYRMELFVTYLQHKMLTQLQAYEPAAKFVADRWERPQGGGGITCILQDGKYPFFYKISILGIQILPL